MNKLQQQRIIDEQKTQELEKENAVLLKKSAEVLAKHYTKRVPNGFTNVRKASLGHTQFISVGLIGDLADCSHAIRDNDIGIGSFTLGMNTKGDYELTKGLRGHTLSCIPEIKYHAMSLRSVPFRKIKAKTLNDLIKKFDKYLMRYLDFTLERVEANDIYCQSNYDTKYFNFNTQPLKEL